MDVKWHIKKFDELTGLQLYRILQLRIMAFVLEQKCIYVDLDDGDQEALHLFATLHDKLVAYARMHVHIATHTGVVRRVVVHKDMRKQQVGLALMQKVLQYFESLKCISQVELSAQFHLVPFYQKLGFIAQGDPYDDVGILHIKMKKTLTN